jgi:hypothetical protein
MTFLIAHKVRGEAALDIADQMDCPECGGHDEECDGCGGDGHWWIIGTSGHRAYPYWWCDTGLLHLMDYGAPVMQCVSPMPSSARDHYAVVEAKEPKFNTRPLLRMLGLGRSKDFTRRF